MKHTIPIKDVKNMVYYEMRKHQSFNDLLFDLNAYSKDKSYKV